MLLTFLAALAAPAVGPCGPVATRSACPEAVALVAEWELAALATTLPKAIDAVNDAGMDRSAEDVAAWKARAAKVASLWAAFRDARFGFAQHRHRKIDPDEPVRRRVIRQR